MDEITDESKQSNADDDNAGAGALVNELLSSFHTNDENLSDFSRLPILVTGGAGYIGSHTCIALYEAGFTNLVIVDNFCNSSPEAINRVKTICSNTDHNDENNTNTNDDTAAQTKTTNKTKPELNLVNYDLDLSLSSNQTKLNAICSSHRFFACIHFAGLKAVGESVSKSLLYYKNNLLSTINVLDALHANACRNIIFSSSATVYGIQAVSPITEASPVGLGITNPYGKTKYFIEEMLSDFSVSHADWTVIILRYFNPIGAHASGLIGEDPQGMPNNLMPFLARVAIAQTKKQSDVAFYNRYAQLKVFGDDYETVDGTGVRDYIHVSDLANGHTFALIHDIIARRANAKKSSNSHESSGRSSQVSIYNLGTGTGTSVLQLKQAMEAACGFEIPHAIVSRRPGDIASVYADCSLAESKLQWKAQLTVEQGCKDSWNWQSKNPYGYLPSPV